MSAWCFRPPFCHFVVSCSQLKVKPNFMTNHFQNVDEESNPANGSTIRIVPTKVPTPQPAVTPDSESGWGEHLHKTRCPGRTSQPRWHHHGRIKVRGFPHQFTTGLRNNKIFSIVYFSIAEENMCNININTNTWRKNVQYQFQYQYLKNIFAISISISISGKYYCNFNIFSIPIFLQYWWFNLNIFATFTT